MAQLRDDLIGLDLAAVAPLGVAQAEDVAHPLVDHDPAFGEPRLDLAGGIEAHQPLRRGVEQQPRGHVEPRAGGVGRAGRVADRADDHRPRIGALVAASERGRADAEQQRDGADGGTRTRTPKEADFKSIFGKGSRIPFVTRIQALRLRSIRTRQSRHTPIYR